MNFSEKFKNSLTKIGDDVSSYLLTLDGTEQEVDNVDFSSRDGYVSYNRPGRDVKIRIKAGRFVTMFTDRFNARQIELFVNEYKSIGEYNKIKDRIILGSGEEDFEIAYTTDNYAERSGSLGGSCMNNVGRNRLKLYADNPRKIKILMLKDDDGMILARAVVWKNAFIREGESAEDRNNSETFKKTIMDRVYSTRDHYINIFNQYATEKGWYIRHGGGLRFKRPDGQEVNCRVKVNLKEFEFGNYPYLDTLKSVSKKGTISNKRWKDDVRFH